VREEVLRAPTVPFAAVESPPDRPTATPAATQTATASPTPQPPATPAPPTATPPPSAPGNGFAQLNGLAHYWQTWNNCGPATLAMNLSYYGLPLTQKQTAAVLKPNWDDKNVSPHEMAAYVRSQGLSALVRVNGNADLLRRYVGAGIPVLVETWLDHDGGMGHYRLVVGYDDAARQWIVYDSYISDGIDPKGPYPGIRILYAEMERLWRVFNGTYVLVYDAATAAAAQEILGDESDDAVMWQRSLERAQAEAAANPSDAFAWFNLGSSLTALGRSADAASAFDQARVLGLPWRMLWYQFEPFHAYYEAGRHAELIALADSVIATAGNIEETFYWRGRALQAMGDIDGASAAYQRAAELNSNFAEARQALEELGG
jgi:tetratricopeptide (TPR) repeat protein